MNINEGEYNYKMFFKLFPYYSINQVKRACEKLNQIFFETSQPLYEQFKIKKPCHFKDIKPCSSTTSFEIIKIFSNHNHGIVKFVTPGGDRFFWNTSHLYDSFEKAQQMNCTKEEISKADITHFLRLVSEMFMMNSDDEKEKQNGYEEEISKLQSLLPFLNPIELSIMYKSFQMLVSLLTKCMPFS